MLRVPIRSRSGNGVLGVMGVVYVISATATLIHYVMSTWGAMGLIDYALQFALLGSAIGGLLFIIIAAQNLGFIGRATTEKSVRDRETAAATGL